MMKFERILVPTDFSASANNALRLAFIFARRFGSEVHIVHAVVLHEEDPYDSSHHFPDVKTLESVIRERAAKQIDNAVASEKAGGLKVTHAEVRGIAAAPVILTYAEERGIDLIVMGTHGRRGLRHLLLGSVAEEVVRLAQCSVITARGKDEHLAGDDIHRILVPIDFSDFGRHALVCAEALAQVFGARLHLLHVVEQSMHPEFYASAEMATLSFDAELQEHCMREMQKMVAESGGGEGQASYYVVEGRAAAEIVSFASKNAIELIVIATHGLTGMEHFLLGSVTEKVVRSSPCPVFTVKRPESE
jgi:nucleotide-binding universal stress UspA family protein